MNFGILIFPQVEELDFVGPWEIVTLWRQVAAGPENCWLIAEGEGPVACAKGMSVNPHLTFEACPPLDYLLVPGGQGTRVEVNNARLVAFVARQAGHCRAVASVCTGAFILHAAGLLKGKRATTHWASLDRLRALGDVQVVEERYTNDGKLWCSAGISAGIDMTLRLVAEVAGEDAAAKIQFAAEYYPSGKPYGDPRAHPQAPAYVKRDATNPAR